MTSLAIIEKEHNHKQDRNSFLVSSDKYTRQTFQEMLPSAL